MYEASYKMKSNGLPILSKDEIDEIANILVLEYQPELMQNPQAFDIEGFSELYLDVNLDYQYLSNDGRYLGMMVFNDTNTLPVYNPEANMAEYLSVNENTVIIDRALLDSRNENVYRFTLAHEAAGHAYFHRDYHFIDPNQISLFEIQNEPIIKCRQREIFTYGIMSYKPLKTDSDWIEWQANYMASAILMPKVSINKLINNLGLKFNSNIDRTKSIIYISDIFKVSRAAAEIRLKNLGWIEELSDETAKQMKIYMK